jgi:hypothetical protein
MISQGTRSTKNRRVLEPIRKLVEREMAIANAQEHFAESTSYEIL